MPKITSAGLKAKIAGFPQVELIHRPTPFRRLDRLTAALGGPTIYVKRDDLTGLAFGGNKSRKLEYILGDALAKKADAVVTWGSLQSNWCMQTAAAARMFGVLPVLVLFKNPGPLPPVDGNVLLDTILGAEITVRERAAGKLVKSADAMDCLEEAASDLRRRGLRPYLVPVGGSLVRGDMDKPLGAIAYLEACREILDQARAAGVEPDFLVHATGSGGTQAGLVLGAKVLSDRARVIGISVSDPKGPFAADVLEIAEAAEKALGLPRTVGPDDVEVLDEYIADGYGVVNRDVVEAVGLVFRTEGIVLDPVYTAKGMVGLIDLIRKGRLKRSDTVVFVHTGGTPALFPHRETILRFLEAEKK